MNLIYEKLDFESFVCGPDKFFLSVKFFFFQLMEKGLFYAVVVLFSFVEYFFFIHCEYGNGLKVDVPNKSTS